MYYMRWEVTDDDNDNDNTSVVHKCNAMIQMTMMKISKKVSLRKGNYLRDHNGHNRSHNTLGNVN